MSQVFVSTIEFRIEGSNQEQASQNAHQYAVKFRDALNDAIDEVDFDVYVKDTEFVGVADSGLEEYNLTYEFEHAGDDHEGAKRAFDEQQALVNEIFESL